jgi:hypothetical protein
VNLSMNEPRRDAQGMADRQTADPIAAFIARWEPSGGKEILPDNILVNIASNDAYHLGALSSERCGDSLYSLDRQTRFG